MADPPPAAGSGEKAAPRYVGIYAERGETMLVLRRAVGDMAGTWYIPGGVIAEGEVPEEAALRELREETGLTPTGPLRFVGSPRMRGRSGSVGLQMTYACRCEEGEVVLSHEHSEAQWMKPRAFRDLTFSEDDLERLKTENPRLHENLRHARHDLDHYLDMHA